MTEEVKDSAKKQVSRGIIWRWTKCVAISVFALVLLLVLTGVAYQEIASARDARQYPPPGRLTDVGGFFHPASEHNQ